MWKDVVRVMIPVARPIEDVYTDLSKKLVRMLPGSQAVRASWSVLNQSHEMIRMALGVFGEDKAEREAKTAGDEAKRFTMDTFLWKSHGEYYAGCRMIHALADAFKVESVFYKEVPDAPQAEAVRAA